MFVNKMENYTEILQKLPDANVKLNDNKHKAYQCVNIKFILTEFVDKINNNNFAKHNTIDNTYCLYIQHTSKHIPVYGLRFLDSCYLHIRQKEIDNLNSILKHKGYHIDSFTLVDYKDISRWFEEPKIIYTTKIEFSIIQEELPKYIE